MSAYLDNAATTRCMPEAAALMQKVLTEDFGNPSSLHTKGMEAEQYLKDARKIIAKSLKAQEKEIYFTEASIGTWNYSFDACLINDFRDIFLGTLSRFGKGVTLWNLMLDDKHKPYRPGGCGTCWGAVTLNSNDHSLVRNSHYYNVAHCSKVLKPGAVRLGTSGYSAAGLTYLWFRNPDGSQAVLFLNESSEQVMVNLVSGKVSVPCKVPAKSIQSVIWTEK